MLGLFGRDTDPSHCGRPTAYRANRHFESAQVAGLDSDTGGERSTILYFIADPFFQQYGGIAYTTLSDTLEYRKCRTVFVSEEPVTDVVRYRALKVGLMRRYPWTDAAVKDPARFLYGSKPGTGIVEIVGNILAMAVAEELIAEALVSNPLVERQRCPSRLMGDALANQYIQKAFASITGKLASAPAGSGARYPLVIPTVLKLQRFKLSPWLPEDVRSTIEVDGLTPCINIPLT